MKKVLSVLTALVLVLALAIPAFAAGNCTITIKPNSTVTSLDGRTFTAYKVLDAKRTASNIVYTVPDGAKTFMATYFSLDANSVTFDYDVAEAIRALSEGTTANSEKLMDFASKIIDAIERGDFGTDVTGKNGAKSGDNYVISDLDEGFYVIAENAGTKKPVSALMLQTTSETIEIKADIPTVDKKIGTSVSTGKSSNNASIGESVPFVIESTVPRTVGYKQYKMIFTDTLSNGLTYNSDLKVYIDGVEATTGFAVLAKGQEIKVTFADVKGKDGQKIEIKYTATVNENATIGTDGNLNTVALEYSNNPSEDTVSETEKVQTKTYVTALKLVKVDATDNNTKLKDAQFTIEGEKVIKVIVYDKENPTGKLVEKTESVKVTATTGSDGVIKFEGLSAGEYTITEIKAPDGYNILPEPIKVTIGWSAPANLTDACTWTYQQGTGDSKKDISLDTDDVATITVENQGGTVLPSTGGIGTTIFYVVGGFLIVGAAVLLVTRKKLALEK